MSGIFPRLVFVFLAWAGFLTAAQAHPLNATQVRVIFGPEQQFKADIYIDFTQALGSVDAYYDLSLQPHARQETTVRKMAAPILRDLHFVFGNQAVPVELTGWQVPVASRATYNDYYVGKMTRLDVAGAIPPARPAFVLQSTDEAPLEYPVALIVERPDHQLKTVDWIEIAGDATDPIDYDASAATSGSIASTTPASGGISGANLSPFQRYWVVKIGTLTRYLGLGFHHIVPEGTDHILFVLGLFFLGISWRKLISQTTVFTIAHAITLYLSTQNIFSLPSWLVEPGIALSITFVALENIFKPKLNAFRLVVIFCFGLIHGLGFASGLKELQLPPHEFMIALLGFNFGVDFGQLFVILLAFLAVGWFRNRPWFFTRIAVPASGVIACVGAYWAVERICFYTHLATF
jgi:hypothetical protein